MSSSRLLDLVSRLLRGSLLLVAGTLIGCNDRPPTAPLPTVAVMIGAGDTAQCGSNGSQLTANVVDTIPGSVFTLGDNAYPDGSTADFRDCYEPTWGRFKSRTHPAAGNHDFVQPHAGPYFAYYGSAAGEPGKGWYSYDLGTWHIIVLNSEVATEANSEQDRWLRADLALSPKRCVLAYWHKARFSSGPHGNEAGVEPFWTALYNAGADVVLSGHDHDYERFAPQTSIGQLDQATGIREFVVGTGGAELRPFDLIRPNSETRVESVYGVLKLTLRPNSYRWDFIAADGQPARVVDSGDALCH